MKLKPVARRRRTPGSLSVSVSFHIEHFPHVADLYAPVKYRYATGKKKEVDSGDLGPYELLKLSNGATLEDQIEDFKASDSAWKKHIPEFVRKG